MSLKHALYAAGAASLLALSAGADEMSGIMVQDPYARASTAMSSSGAAFMGLVNNGSEEDRLISARSDIAERVELHTHTEDENGVMRMIEVEEGFAIPAGGIHMLERGGDHVMFLGLKESLDQGDVVSVTLTFENAGEVVVDIPVDLERKPAHGGHSNHGG